jgi:23S rRNA pseudouridine955/2504/2580 synthase
MKPKSEYVITSEEAGMRLDRFAGKLLRDTPKSHIEKLIRKGDIKVNQKKAAGSLRLALSDSVSLPYMSVPEKPLPQNTLPPSLAILYESEILIALEKPPYMLSQPDGSNRPCVSTFLSEYLPISSPTFAYGVLNRLDFNTSGIILAAKTSRAARILNALPIEKSYLAIICGKLSTSPLELTTYAVKEEAQNKVTLYLDPAKERVEMKTTFTTLEEARDLSLIMATLTSGKTHQIRSQLAFMSNAVIGDLKYFTPESKALTTQFKCRHQMLHAYRVVIPPNELSTEPLTITCDPPKEFSTLWETLSQI